jgi:hypothetical protein
VSRDGRPSTLHPGGFGHVPVALMRDPRAEDEHVDVYAAISSALRFKDGEGEVRMRRIAERAHRRPHTVRRAEADLKSWGYLDVIERDGCPKFYRLLPTAPQRAEAERERRKDAEALDPVATGRIGGKAKAPVRQGPPLKGPGSKGKAPAVRDRTPQRSTSESASGGYEALWAAFAKALGHADFTQITSKTKEHISKAVQAIAAVGAVPAEVPFRVARYQELTNRRLPKPLEVRDAWGSIDCDRARLAREVRERFLRTYRNEESADVIAVYTMEANPDATDADTLIRRHEQEEAG